MPSEAQKFIKESEDTLIASIATIHLIEEKEDNSGTVIGSKDYDFSKKEDIYTFENDLKKLKAKNLDQLFGFNMIQPMAENNHGGYIITGINATRISSTHDVEFQLQGYWEWKTVLLVSSYDRVTLGWTDSFSSSESSHLAFGNRYSDGASITLTKHPYNTSGFFNKGVMWRHRTNHRTYGNVLARIYHNGISNKEFGMWFEYVAPGGPTSDDSWAIDVLNRIASYFGVPMPIHIDRFKTFVKRQI